MKSVILLFISTAGFAQQHLHTIYTKQPKPDISIRCFTPGNYPEIHNDPNITPTGGFRIVCQSSIRKSEGPLYVIDGVPHYSKSPFGSRIRPESIISIDILKGADVTTLYGSRAANGVILITTNKKRKHRN